MVRISVTPFGFTVHIGGLLVGTYRTRDDAEQVARDQSRPWRRVA